MTSAPVTPILSVWDIPLRLWRLIMPAAVKDYDAKVDSKKRITLRNAPFDYYHVEEYSDGRIILEPRVLEAPFEVSANTLSMMDASMQNLSKGKVSDAVDLSDFED